MASSPRSAAGGGSKMLIMDVCGAFLRPLGGWFAITKMVQLMSDLGVDEAATRSALLRMRSRGLLDPERRRGVRGYRLSDEAVPLLLDAEQRIFGYRVPARLSDGWVLVAFSVPEDERSKRHLLRSRLAWLGFGNLSNGLWIAPRRMARDVEKSVRELGFERYVMIFEASYYGLAELDRLLQGAWDLTELAAMYAEYVTWARPLAAHWADVERPVGRQTFTDYTWNMYNWRKFPYLDPGLPAEVLPAEWAGAQAAELFHQLHGRLEQPATSYVRSVLYGPGVPAPAEPE